MATLTELTKAITTNTIGSDDKGQRAITRDLFYTQDNKGVQGLLTDDLKKYVDTADISRMKLITLDFFIPAFLEKLCSVYDVAPVFKYEEGVGDKDIELFTALIEETRIHSIFQESFLRCRLHNTIIANVKYASNLDRVFVDNSYHAGNTEVLTYSDVHTEPKIIYWEEVKGANSIWIVWDREKGFHYWTPKKPEYDAKINDIVGAKHPIGDNPDLLGPDYWPFVVYRYRDHSNKFWGYGMDAIVELIRSINVLLTVCNDDTIQETIRLLILNFNPTGTEGERGQLKTGLRHPLFMESAIGDSKPEGEILSANLYNKDVVELIEKLTDFVSKLHNVDNILRAELQQNLSGIALRLKNEPQLRQWAKDINILRPMDRDLLQTLVDVNNYHREPGRQISDGFLERVSVDYQEPRIVTDEKEDYELERAKWEDGTSSPIRYILKKNPEFNEEEAGEYIRLNLAVFNGIMGIGVGIPVDEEQEGDIG